jgi:hypothetical protein
MAPQLSDAAANLIAALPDNAQNLTVDQVQQLADLHGKIAEQSAASLEAMQMVIKLVEERGGGEDTPVGELVTDDERAYVDEVEPRPRAARCACPQRDRRSWVGPRRHLEETVVDEQR